MKEYKSPSFVFQGREYRDGAVLLDEGRSQLELIEKRRSRFGRTRLTSVAKLSYGVGTLEQLVGGDTVRLGDASIRLLSPQAASELVDILSAPRRQAMDSCVQDLRAPLRGFLIKRAEALTIVDRLAGDPRTPVVRNRSMIGDGAKEPVKALVDALTQQVGEALSQIQKTLDHAPEVVRTEFVERVCALTCALDALQTAIMRNDEGGAKEADALLRAITRLETGQLSAPAVGNKDGSSEVVGSFLDSVLARMKEIYSGARVP